MLLPLILLLAAPPERPMAEAITFFEKKVRPVLVRACNNCHSADTNSRGGLRVDDRNGLLTGGNSGPAIVPRQPEKSPLIKALAHADGGLKMPPKQKLTDEEIADLTKWVKDGAAWPEVRVKLPSKPDVRYETARKEHWAWQPLTRPTLPVVKDRGWAESDIDRFVLAKLEAKGLRPVADASREALIRRVTFDLTGLPPTPEEIECLRRGRLGPAHIEKPRGPPPGSVRGTRERWGRHWLDVARYGESTGVIAERARSRTPGGTATTSINSFNNGQAVRPVYPRAGRRRPACPPTPRNERDEQSGRNRFPGPGCQGRQPAVQGPVPHGQRRRADRRGQPLGARH